MSKEGKMWQAMEKSGDGDEPAVPESERRAPLSTAYDAELDRGGSSPIKRVPAPETPPDASVVVVNEERGEAASQIRAIRSKILAMNENDPPRVIVVTSGSREEGKTTISINLAAALKEVQSDRVVVLDADLRGPALHYLANIQPAEGLMEILSNGLTLDNRVYETTVPGLDIIPLRPDHNLGGQEGLLAERAQPLVQELRRHYSFIIVDTPPVLSSSEARTFGRFADGTVVIARLEKTPRDVVRRAVEELENSGVKLLGCVLTHREHHVPGIIYRLVGHTPGYYYYRYGHRRRYKGNRQETRGEAQE